MKPADDLQSEKLFCDHLGAVKNDAVDVMNFTVSRPEGAGLVAYLQRGEFEASVATRIAFCLAESARTRGSRFLF